MSNVLACDLGGTEMKLAIGYEGGGLSEPLIIPTPTEVDEVMHEIGKGWNALAAEMVGPGKISAAVIAAPGPVVDCGDGTYTVDLTNVGGATGQIDLSEVLASEHSNYDGLGILTLNDANAAAYEAPGIARAVGGVSGRLITYITHSTGVGGATLDTHTRQVASDATGEKAEFGHMTMKMPNGAYTTVEKLVSGSGIQERFGISAKDMGSRPQDFWSKRWEDIGTYFAQGIAPAVSLIGMDAIVIGGGVSRSRSRYEDYMSSELEQAVAVMPNGVVDTAPPIIFVPESEISTFGLNGAVKALRIHQEDV